MTTAAPSTALVTIQPVFTDAEHLALAGLLAGYRDLTREAYALGLRQFTSWCRARSPPLFAVRRADIEGFARDLEAQGRGARQPHPAAVHHRRVLPVRGEEELPGHSPGAHVRRPGWITSRTPPPWTATSSAPSWSPPGSAAGRARADLPARAQRAAGAGGHRRRHRAAWPRARPPHPAHHPQGRQGRHDPAGPAYGPATGLAVAERTDGPVFLAADGRRPVRHGTGRIVRKVACRAGITKAVTPHTLRRAFITAALDAGVPLRDVQEAAR